jgi:hypothetical protein
MLSVLFLLPQRHIIQMKSQSRPYLLPPWTILHMHARGFFLMVRGAEIFSSTVPLSQCKNIYSSSFEYLMFYVLYPFVTYLLTLPRMQRSYTSREWSVDVSRQSHEDATTIACLRNKMFPLIHIALGTATRCASQTSCCLVRPRVWGSNYHVFHVCVPRIALSLLQRLLTPSPSATQSHTAC